MYYVNPVKGRYPNKKRGNMHRSYHVKIEWFGGKVRTKDSIDMR